MFSVQYGYSVLNTSVKVIFFLLLYTKGLIHLCNIYFFRTVLMLLKMVVEYCHCVEDIPTATPDILTRLVELLKVFYIIIIILIC